jgi:uncharacterized protein DUF4185
MEERRNRRGTAVRALIRTLVAAAMAILATALMVRPAGASPTVVDHGPLVGPSGVLRDGGQSVRLGHRILWLFGDTLYPNCDPVCASNSAGLGGAAGPTEELGAEFIPLTPAERTAWHGGDDRIAVWPMGAIRIGTTAAAVFYARYHVAGALDYEPLGWGIATVAVGDRVATRVLEMSGLPFGHPVRVGRWVFAYASERSGWMQFSSKVARAPLASMTDPAAWRYWDGAGWSPDVASAAFVLPGPSGALSVSWNRSLGQYLATYNLALSNRIEIRTAPSPTGPWSAATTLFTGLDAPAGTFDYAGMEHSDLARQQGRVITVTYYHPLGARQGEIRRVSVSLA